MGLGGFFKKLFGKSEPTAPTAQAAPQGVPGAVDTVGSPTPAAPTPAVPVAPAMSSPATPEKTA